LWIIEDNPVKIGSEAPLRERTKKDRRCDKSARALGKNGSLKNPVFGSVASFDFQLCKAYLVPEKIYHRIVLFYRQREC